MTSPSPPCAHCWTNASGTWRPPSDRGFRRSWAPRWGASRATIRLATRCGTAWRPGPARSHSRGATWRGSTRSSTARLRIELRAPALDLPFHQVPRLDPGAEVRPVGSLEELIDTFAGVLETNAPPDEIERALDGLSRFAADRPDGFERRTGPLRKRASKLLGRRPVVEHVVGFAAPGPARPGPGLDGGGACPAQTLHRDPTGVFCGAADARNRQAGDRNEGAPAPGAPYPPGRLDRSAGPGEAGPGDRGVGPGRCGTGTAAPGSGPPCRGAGGRFRSPRGAGRRGPARARRPGTPSWARPPVSGWPRRGRGAPTGTISPSRRVTRAGPRCRTCGSHPDAGGARAAHVPRTELPLSFSPPGRGAATPEEGRPLPAQCNAAPGRG